MTICDREPGTIAGNQPLASGGWKYLIRWEVPGRGMKYGTYLHRSQFLLRDGPNPTQCP